MTLTCTTTDTSPYPKDSSFFLEVGKSYTAIREQIYQGIKCFILEADPIGALYPAYMFGKIKIGHTYSVIENNKRITGTVIEIIGNKYKVNWSDGTQTIEDNVSSTK